MIQMDGAPEQLILSSGSLSGCSFRERVEAAASAGFDAIGLSLQEYRSIAEAEMRPREMQALLAANGVRVAELEAIIGFSAESASNLGALGPGLSYTSASDLREFWQMAELFEPRHLQVAGSFHTSVLEPDAGEKFAALCDAAADVGLRLCVEFVPISNVPDAGVALRVVEEADRPNGGVTIDSWQHVRGAHNVDLLTAIPASRVGLIQINDGPAEPADPDYVTDTVNHRRPPGEGDFDLPVLLRTILDIGARTPISVEVMSEELRHLAPPEVARRLAEGSRKVVPA